jgi:hypothetical protein
MIVTSVHHKINQKKKTLVQCFYFLANFHNLTTPQKKGLANPTNGFLRFKKEHAPNLDQKNLEVARFRQCVLVGRQK